MSFARSGIRSAVPSRRRRAPSRGLTTRPSGCVSSADSLTHTQHRHSPQTIAERRTYCTLLYKRLPHSLFAQDQLDSLSVRAESLWHSEATSENIREQRPSSARRLTCKYVRRSCDFATTTSFFLFSWLSFVAGRAVARKVDQWLSSARSPRTAMRESTTTRATPTRIEQSAEKLSTLAGVIRDALDRHATDEAVVDSVCMCIPDLWPVKCNLRSGRLATRGETGHATHSLTHMLTHILRLSLRSPLSSHSAASLGTLTFAEHTVPTSTSRVPCGDIHIHTVFSRAMRVLQSMCVRRYHLRSYCSLTIDVDAYLLYFILWLSQM